MLGGFIVTILEDELKNKFRTDYENYKNAKAKIALIGQPGAGKSSLINALVGEPLFKVGIHTDTTTEAQEVSFESLIITDLPGYGTQAFPYEKWLEIFHPEQYDLYIFVFEGKLHDSDAKLFESLKQWKMLRQHPHFIVRNKSDQIWDEDKELDELKEIIKEDVYSKMGDRSADVYFTSCKEKTGIIELKKAILESSVTSIIKSKLISSFKAQNLNDLTQKREECDNIIHLAALASAANGFNPIPGTDIAVDYKIISEMINEIKNSFGLNDIKDISKFEKYGPTATNIINRILQYIGQEGIKKFLQFILKKFGEKILIQKGAKFIPLLGNLISAGISAGIVEYMGKQVADDCYELAKIILEDTCKKHL